MMTTPRRKNISPAAVAALDLFTELAAHLGESADKALIKAILAPRGRDKVRRFRGVTRRAVIARDGRVCFYCAAPIPAAAPVHVDHVVPHCRGGLTVASNGVAACAPCNLAKSSKVW